MRSSRLALTAVAAVLPAALAGCSSSGSATAGSAASAAAAAAAANPDAGLLTGSRLKTALITTGIPSGYAANDSATGDSGSSYQAPGSATAPTMSCANLESTGWVNLAGKQSASFAQNAYVNSRSSAEFAQEVDAYEGSTAQDVMNALARIGTTCPSFSDPGTKSTVKVTAASGNSLGDGTVTITLTDSQWNSSETLVAVRVGHNVVTVQNSATGNSASYANTLAASITANVKKLG